MVRPVSCPANTCLRNSTGDSKPWIDAAKKRLHHNVNAALVAYVGILAEFRILATA